MNIDDITQIGSLVLLIGFFAYMVFGLKRTTSRYDDPAYQHRQERLQERTVEAAERQADALTDIARSLRK